MSDDRAELEAALYRYYRLGKFWLRQGCRWVLYSRDCLNPEPVPYSDDEWP